MQHYLRVNFVQRFGSSLALNVHFHALVLDGVYTTSSPSIPPIFRSAPRLTQSEVERVQRDLTRRIASALRSFHIHAGPDCDPPPIPGSEDSLLPFLLAASIQSRTALGRGSGHPIPRIIDPPNKGDSRADKPTTPALTCTRDGYSPHAATLIPKGDHPLRERLCRYITRPPLAQGRLSITEDGNVLWKLRSPWRDGTSAFVFKPLAFIERLVAGSPSKRPTGAFRSRCAGPGLTSPTRASISSHTTAYLRPPLHCATLSSLHPAHANLSRMAPAPAARESSGPHGLTYSSACLTSTSSAAPTVIRAGIYSHTSPTHSSSVAFSRTLACQLGRRLLPHRANPASHGCLGTCSANRFAENCSALMPKLRVMG